MLPRELQQLLDAVDAAERQAETLVGDVSQEEVNWQPSPTSWSIAQCLDHLALINPFYLRGFAERLAEARQRGIGPFAGLHPTPIGRWFVRSFEPPPRFKVKANAQVVPRSSLQREALVPNFKASHEVYRTMIVQAAEVDVNRVTGRNPFLPFISMRIATVLQIIPAHDRRHLWQANNVKQTLRARL